MEKSEPFCIAGGNVTGAAMVENSTMISQKVKWRITIWSGKTHFSYVLKRSESRHSNSDLYTNFTAASYTQHKYWHMLQHGWTLKTLCSTKPTRHKRTNVVSVHFYEVPSVDRFIWTERIIVVARSWRKRIVNYYLTYTVSIGDDEKVLEMESDDSWTTLWMSLMYLRTLHYPFKNS